MELVALKVKITRDAKGHLIYPDFASLAFVVAGNDVTFAGGWKYDQVSEIDDDEVDSPRGQKWGVRLVPDQFAIEAEVAFPALVSRMTEADLAAFWDDRAHIRMPDEKRNADELTSLHAEFILVRDLAVEFPGNTKLQDRLATLKTALQKALDPDDSTPGVRKNLMRRWADAKVTLGITIKAP